VFREVERVGAIREQRGEPLGEYGVYYAAAMKAFFLSVL